MRRPAEPAPDRKDWTWVLDRPCPECGYDAADVEPARLGDLIRDSAVRWRAVLRRADVVQRTTPTVWSPLEYACHVRDVHRTMFTRLTAMLSEDAPTFPDWDQDQAARSGRYWEQSPDLVAVELTREAEAVAALYETCAGEAWQRRGTRSNGSEFTVAGLGRYHLHDAVHHLHDVGAGEPSPSGSSRRGGARRGR